MKKIIALMLALGLCVPSNAVVTKSAKLNTHKPQPTVKIVNKTTNEKTKDLEGKVMQIVGGCVLLFFITTLGNLFAYKILQGSEATEE
jgi:hypothetical protein